MTASPHPNPSERVAPVATAKSRLRAGARFFGAAGVRACRGALLVICAATAAAPAGVITPTRESLARPVKLSTPPPVLAPAPVSASASTRVPAAPEPQLAAFHPAASAAAPTHLPLTAPTAELLHEQAPDPAPEPAPEAPRSPLTPGEVPPGPTGRVIWMQVTAYCGCRKCCGPAACGLTASGKPVSYNDGAFVAADTSLLPFGTRLVIPGYADEQPVEVVDRGSAIRGERLDVFFPTHEQALAWGRRWLPVTVLE